MSSSFLDIVHGSVISELQYASHLFRPVGDNSWSPEIVSKASVKIPCCIYMLKSFSSLLISVFFGVACKYEICKCFYWSTGKYEIKNRTSAH